MSILPGQNHSGMFSYFQTEEEEKRAKPAGAHKYWRLMTNPEACPSLQEELQAVSPFPGGRAHTITPFCIWMIYSKKTTWNTLTEGGICYTSVFAPYTEQTSSGLGKDME